MRRARSEVSEVPEILRRGEVMRELGIGRRTLRGLIASKRLTPRKFHPDGRAVFLRVEVMQVKREVMGSFLNEENQTGKL